VYVQIEKAFFLFSIPPLIFGRYLTGIKLTTTKARKTQHQYPGWNEISKKNSFKKNSMYTGGLDKE
jgi:hypothetical protein